MLVEAKCIMDAFDSPSCQHFKMGSVYQIERDSELARLKTSGGKLGRYVFEFDRNAGPDDAPHDYSCKKPGCGAMFKTLAALGSHTRTAHKSGEREESDEVVVAKDLRGKKKNKTFSCKTPGCGVTGIPNLHALKMHKKTHAAVGQAA